jgi:hypothetical protein
MGTAMRASLALPLVLALTSSSPFAAVSEGAGGPLLPCGTSGGKDASGDSRQVLNVFDAVKGVCEQAGESIDGLVPSSCSSAECQRVVQLAQDSCSQTFATDGFLKIAFAGLWTSFTQAAVICAATPHSADAQVRARESSAPRSAPHCR